MFIIDCVSSSKFLIDMVAAVSIFPPTRDDQHHISTNLLAANGTPTPTHRRQAKLDLGLLNYIPEHNFYVAEVTVPKLGSDFMKKNSLLVNGEGHMLLP